MITIHSFLQRAQTARLSGPQFEAATRIGRAVGVGYDDPTFDEPAAVTRAPAPQPWGALPLKPPGRA